MIDVYTWTTGNGRKVPIFLEETSTPYRLVMVDISRPCANSLADSQS
ncbi:MAG: hypothetical protein ACRECO_05975 [Xanthobacteraceae bacterium]